MIAALIITVEGIFLNAQAAASTSLAGIVSTGSGSLNVRASASSGSAFLKALPKGSYVTLISKTNGWWKVEYATKTFGYVSANYITVASGTSAASVSASNLNVRWGAGTSSSVKSVLPSGKIVIILSSANGWSRILYNGTQTGYVSSKYLSTNFNSDTMVWPVPASSKINQYFVSGSHNGIDIGSSVHGVTGDKIVAAYGGSVAYSGWFDGYGYVAYINSYYHGKYIQTRYAHLVSSPYVAAGASVGKGQTIGAMGNSGTSTGPHLHFEVRIRSGSGTCIANSESTPVSPLDYVSY